MKCFTVYSNRFATPRFATLYGIMLLLTCTFGLPCEAQENSSAKADSLYVFRFIEVSPEKVSDWKQAVASKQKQFNSDPDSSRWGTWRIVSGPRTNQFARGFGTTEDRLTNPIHASHGLAASWEDPEAKYWLENVVPHQETSGNRQIWRVIDGLSSQQRESASPSRFLSHRRWRMKPGMYQRLEANYKKIVSVFNHLAHPIDFGVARLVDGGDFMIYAETTAYDDYADVPTAAEFRDAFIELHGEEAFLACLEEHNAVMQENGIVETETWLYEPELSNLQPTELPSSEIATSLVQSHIDRVVHCFENRDAEGLSNEYVDGAIRSLGIDPEPVSGSRAIRVFIDRAFERDEDSGVQKLEGKILKARFLTPDTIVAYGTFIVTDGDNEVVRQGKWGDVLQVKDGEAKFLMQSGYAENLESLSQKSLPNDYPITADTNGEDYRKIQASIDRFTTAFNQGDVQSLVNEFSEDGVRLVSGVSGVFTGKDAIQESFQAKWSGEVVFGDGATLSAKTLHLKRINNRFLAASGIWRLADQNGKIIDGGHWGNVFEQQGNEVKLILECAGSRQ